MNIVLTGLRGSGKTKLGKILAKKLDWKFIDLDEEIVKKEKRSIPAIVNKEGWNYFREKEALKVRETSSLDMTVIATGGGTILFEENAKILGKNGMVIYLHRTPEECSKYIKNSTDRPALTNEKNLLSEMQKLYQTRHHIYTENAEHILNRTDDLEKDADEIVDKVLSTLFGA